MNVTDAQRASSAAGLILAGLAASLGLSVLASGVGALVPGSYAGVWPMIQQVLWLGTASTLAMGLFQLSSAVSEGQLLRLAAAVMAIDALSDVAAALLAPEMGSGPFLSDGLRLLSLVSRGLLISAMVQVTHKTHAWVLPLLGTVGLLTVMRVALSVAVSHHLVDLAVYRNPVFPIAMPLVSLFNGSALLVSAIAVKGAVTGGPNVTTPALVAAAGLRPSPAQPVTPIADFLVGSILLAVGIGVTAVSLSVASNGGRYVVATGAIGVGLGRIIHGFIKLARNG